MEIKFRIKEGHDSDWTHFNLEMSESWACDLGNLLYEGNKTLGQYIGLKDENGIEVYNRDILKIAQIDDFSGKEIITIDYISYFKKIASFRLHSNPEYLFFKYADSFEVIGNIDENPELL